MPGSSIASMSKHGVLRLGLAALAQDDKEKFMTAMDKFREECGVVAIYAHPEAEKLAYLGLHALQHRGQESAGIASSDGMGLHVHKAMGLGADIFVEGV